MSNYYKIERALLCYAPQKMTDEQKHDIELSISHYDEFHKCPRISKESELYNFTSMLLFQEAQNNVNNVSDYFLEKYNINIISLLLETMLNEIFK